MKFTAYDIINKKPIDLFRIMLDKDGIPTSFVDTSQEVYDHRQIHLQVDISVLTNESVLSGVYESFSIVQENVKSFDEILSDDDPI